MTVFVFLLLLLLVGLGLVLYWYCWYWWDNTYSKTIKTMKPIYNNINPCKTQKKLLVQTYHDKSKIPNKVYKNIKKYAPEYKHIIYDDKDCIKFLNKYYGKKVSDRFKNLANGAHKADLFRYCWLYKNGGVYLDIKIILVKPLKDIFTEPKYLYTCNASGRPTFATRSIFQGIISTPPKHPIFKTLINKILATPDIVLKIDYLRFTKDFYLSVNGNKNKNKIKLLNEICDDKLNWDLKSDRYGFKCAIYNSFNKPKDRLFIVRYTDYPW